MENLLSLFREKGGIATENESFVRIGSLKEGWMVEVNARTKNAEAQLIITLQNNVVFAGTIKGLQELITAPDDERSIATES